jgi:hypothetical protein
VEEPTTPTETTPSSAWVARQGSASALLGGLLVVLGVVFLLVQTLHVDFWEVGWPFFIIVPGITVYALALVMRGRTGELLAVIGSIMTVNGLLLLYQNSTDHWATWAYAWALVFPTSIGVGQLLYGWLTESHRLIVSGTRMTLAGLAIFVLGAFFFEGIINISGGDFGGRFWNLGRFVFPAVLIAAGGLLLYRAYRRIDDRG